MSEESLPVIPLRDFASGVYRSKEISEYMRPLNSVELGINCHFDSKGAIRGRLGYTALGDQIVSDKNILGLYDFRDAGAGTNNQALAVVSDGTNNDIYYNNSGTWTKTLEDDTKDLKTRFATFSDLVIRVNGTDNAKSWNGNPATAWATTGGNLDIGDAPVGHLVEVYKSRLYIGNNTDRLYYSSIPNSSGVVTWTVASDFVDINPNDGDNFTALKRYGLELLTFKKNYIYRWRGVEGTDPDPLISIGTWSQESVVETKMGIMYHNPNGIYVYAGGYPNEISRPISDFIDNVSSSEYGSVASWEDGDHAYFSVGDVTLSGVTFTNVVLRYTISSQVWTIYSTADRMRIGTRYISGTTDSRIVGGSDGYVHTWNSGNTDNTTGISYQLVTGYYEVGAIASATSTINKLATIASKAQGMKIAFQVDDEERWHPIGQIRKYITIFGSSDVNIKGHRVRFKLLGVTSAEQWIFEGIEILRGVRSGVIK